MFEQQLLEFMQSRGVHIRGKINFSVTGKWQRFADATKNKRDKDLFVILHDFDRGTTFGDWHYPEDWITFWNPAYEPPSLYEQLEREKEILLERKMQEYERGKRGWRAWELWSRYYATYDTENHPYVKKKRIRAYYSKQVRSSLLIPVRDIDYNWVTVQIIKPDGFKRAWKGTTWNGHMCWLSEKLADDYDGIIRVCEGYATGCTIYEAIGYPVVCALSAVNLLSVCRSLRNKFRYAAIQIAADNDQWNKDNVGIKFAKTAALQSNATIYVPDFTGLDIAKKPTDFNDLMCLNGIECVENQLLKLRR